MAQERWNAGKYPSSLLEAMALQVILYTLGYDLTSEVTVEIAQGNVFVLLEVPGKGKAAFPAGSFEDSTEGMKKLYLELKRDWKELATDSDKEALFAASVSSSKMPFIILALELSGLTRPPRRVLH